MGIVVFLSLAGRPAAAQMPRPAGEQPVPPDSARPDGARARPDSTRVYKLPQIEVNASILTSAGPRTGSGMPARTSVLDRDRIEAWEPRVLPDVLATQPGVSVYDDLGTPFMVNLSTRGFTAGPTIGLPPGISVFLDGVRQNEADAQEVNFALLPMEHIKRVELLSGTASLLGPNSLGGAINLVTDRGEGPTHGEIEATAGTYGTYSGQATVSAFKHGWDYYLSGDYAREDGWRQDTGGRNYSTFFNLGRTGDTRGIRLQAFANGSRVREAGSLPESLFDVDPRIDFTPGDWNVLAAQQVSVSGYQPVGAGRGSFTTYLRRYAGDGFNVNQAPDNSVLASTRNWTFGTTVDWRYSHPLHAALLDLRLGADGAADAVRVRLFSVPPDIPLRTGQSPSASDSVTTDVHSPSFDVAGYSLADLHLGRATVSAGARYDLVGVPFRDLLSPDQNQTHVYHRISPRAGVNLAFGAFSTYASVGQSFRAPAILELGCADPDAACPLPFALGDDPALRPVRATTYETGARWLHHGLRLDGSVYLSDVRDEIFFVSSPTSIVSGYFVNLDRTRRSGAELSAQGALGEHVTWYANYAYTRATFESPVDIFSARSDSAFAGSPLAGDNQVRAGDRLPLVPDHQLKAGFLARVGPSLSAGFDGRYIGHQWFRGDEANQTRPLGAYGVLDGRIGYRLEGWDVSAITDNLLDSRRAIFGTFNENRRTGDLERFLTPMTARTFKIVLRRQVGGGTYSDPD
jgi:outer membrane receptor protein involved in Fe transport